MGRFDALTQLEEKQEKKAPLPELPSPSTNIPQMQNEKRESEYEKKTARPQTLLSANPQDRKTANQSPSLILLEKPERYTTRLEPSLVKKLKIYAAEKDMNDYDVIKIALNQYFEKNK